MNLTVKNATAALLLTLASTGTAQAQQIFFDPMNAQTFYMSPDGGKFITAHDSNTLKQLGKFKGLDFLDTSAFSDAAQQLSPFEQAVKSMTREIAESNVETELQSVNLKILSGDYGILTAKEQIRLRSPSIKKVIHRMWC